MFPSDQASAEADPAVLLRRIAQQDEAALELLYRALSGAVFAFVQRRLDDSHESESVVVDTFHEVWKHAARFQGNSQVKTWVLGIARHKLLDVLRQRKGFTHEDIDDLAETLPDERPGVFAELVQQQRAEWVARCLRKLPAEQRECLHLLFYEGLSVAEIGAVQACPDNTVKTRVFHAKRKIRACLERWLHASGEVPGDAASS